MSRTGHGHMIIVIKYGLYSTQQSPNGDASLFVCTFVSCPKQGPKMEGVVLNRVGILGLFCPKKG